MFSHLKDCLLNLLHLVFSVVYEPTTSTVVYDIPSDVVADIGPDTSQNIAYEVTKKVITTPNPAYDVIQR